MWSSQPVGGRRPRSRPRRILLTTLLMVVFFAMPIVLRHLAERAELADLLWTVPLLLYGLAVAPRVSYRWFDAFLLLVPLYGIFLFWLFTWRLSYLPYRDWAPRPDEVPYWQRVEHRDEPAAQL